MSKEVIDQLTAQVEIERIYHFIYHFQNQQYHRLLIVLNSKCQLSTSVIEPLIDKSLAGLPDVTYMIMHSGELKSELKNGNLFFTVVCAHKNLIYHDGKKFPASPTAEEVQGIAFKAKEHFLQAQHKGSDFLKGLEFYSNIVSIDQAAFMLHQAAEITFRGMDKAVFNKNKPSHELHEHINLFCRYLPALRSVFPKDNEYEYGLLKLLDKAYCGVRYTNYVIEREHLDILVKKIRVLLDWCNTFYNECQTEIKGILTSIGPDERQLHVAPATILQTANMDTVLPVVDQIKENHQQNLKIITDKICNKHPIIQIRKLGFKTFSYQTSTVYSTKNQNQDLVHYYLLVIIKGNTSVRSYTSCQGNIKATLLIHHEQEIKYALQKENRFFIHALNTGEIIYNPSGTSIFECLYGTSDFIIPEPNWKHSYKSAKHFFDSRLDRLVGMLYDSIDHIKEYIDDSAPEACALLLMQCIEQVCISLIYINTGYKVNNHHIPFLRDLCEMISPGVSKILHQNTANDKQQMEAVINCVQNIRHKGCVALQLEDITILLMRADSLIALVKEICNVELERLKKLADTDSEQCQTQV